MQILTKKTTILFSPELYDQLSQLAKLSHTSIAKLIRQAVVDRYLLSDKRKREQAVKELSEIGSPVSTWSMMEEEIIEGRNADIL